MLREDVVNDEVGLKVGVIVGVVDVVVVVGKVDASNATKTLNLDTKESKILIPEQTRVFIA